MPKVIEPKGPYGFRGTIEPVAAELFLIPKRKAGMPCPASLAGSTWLGISGTSTGIEGGDLRGSATGTLPV